MTQEVRIGTVKIGGDNPLVIIAGPCVIEGERFVLELAEKLKKIVCEEVGLPLIFKASFDKANRTSIHSFRGPGLKEGLKILAKVKAEVRVPILSDVHESWQVKEVVGILDCIQIPAFLCRQTDLLLEAARSGLAVNVKKGQFMSPYDMKYVIEKITSQGNSQVILTERGTFFGYRDLVNDMRSLVIMRSLGYPVLYDATHSVQSPGSKEGSSGGQREFVPHLVRGALGVGVDGLYLEVHPNPEKALSDAETSWPLDKLKELLEMALEIDLVRRRYWR